MYAIIGTPGSAHHTWRWFPPSAIEEARAWLEATHLQSLQGSPALDYADIEAQLLPDQEAERLVYPDGTRVYHWDPSVSMDADDTGREYEAWAFRANEGLEGHDQ